MKNGMEEGNNGLPEDQMEIQNVIARIVENSEHTPDKCMS